MSRRHVDLLMTLRNDGDSDPPFLKPGITSDRSVRILSVRKVHE